MLLVERILETHQAQAYRAVQHVRVLRLGHGVVIDVDHVIEHAHGGAYGAAQLVQVEAVLVDVLGQVDGTQVAHGDLVLVGVEGDLGAQVGRVHHAHMLLRRAQVAGILEGHPGMAGLEQHAQHLAPQVLRLEGLEQLELAAAGHGLVLRVALLESLAVQVVQVRHIVGGEQGPLAAVEDPLHEQVGDPVGGIHVVGAAAVVAGVLAQLDELLDIQVPGFQVGADRALALAALVYRHRGVVDHLQERHHTLGLAVGALDVGAQGSHRGPVVAQAAGKLGQHGVVLDGAVDAVQVVRHRGEVAGGQLRPQGAGVEQGRGGAHVVKGRQQLVELDGPGVLVILLGSEAHGHAHEEDLGQLDAHVIAVDKIAVVQGLQAQVGELQVPLGQQCLAEALQVEVLQVRCQQFQRHPLFDVGGQGLGVAG